MSTPRVLGLVLVAIVGVASGCGDDGTTPPAVPADGGVDARPLAERFTSPADFSRDGCTPGSLIGFDPRGVWHHQVEIGGFGTQAVATRWYDGDDGALTALLNGRDADVVTLDDDDLFARRMTVSDDGSVSLTAWDVCRRDPDGSVFGRIASCSSDEVFECFTATFFARHIGRRAGEDEAAGLELVGEFAGTDGAWADVAGISINVRVAGGLAYVVRYEDGLRIVDVSDPTTPIEVGWSPPAQLQYGEVYNDVKVVDGPDARRYALCASDQRGIVAIDVTDPGQPVEVAAFPEIPGVGLAIMDVHTLFTETRAGRTRAYLAETHETALQIWDVTDPRAPVFEAKWAHPDVDDTPGAYLHDLYVEDGRVYLNYWDLGLVVVDATDPAAITMLGQYDDYEPRSNHSNWVTTVGDRKLSVVGDEDWGAHLRIIDVTDPGSATWMTRVGELSLRDEVSIHNIMAFGDRAYVAWYQDGVRVIDLSDPTAPAVEAYYNTWNQLPGESFFEGAIGLDVDLDAGLIYVADTQRGLMILRQP